jgi:2-amino-4-hydroxy-6-hydroxymethyldihydropteridine diphosphokinase
MTTTRAGIALGSNLGERSAHLQAAITALRLLSKPGEPVLLAPVYESEPRFCPPGSPPFLNTVMEIGHDGGEEGALPLLNQLLAIEASLGRVRDGVRNSSRSIDLDLLYLGDLRLATARLSLPHPGIVDRRFVLQPLADIRPDLVPAGQALTVRELLERLPASEPPLRIHEPLPC